MNNKITIEKTFITTGLLLMGIIISYVFISSLNTLPKASGSAPTGYQTNWSSSSQITLSSAIPYTLFATSTPDCTARIVTTRASQIIIKFGDYVSTLEANTGHLQAASTTISYDSGLYGCGLWTAVAVSTTSAAGITVTEFKGFK